MAFNQPKELIFLGTQTASNSASLAFTSLITSQYPVYLIKVRNLLPATNNVNLLVTFSTDNGATYLNTNYKWSSRKTTDSTNAVLSSSDSDSSITLATALSNTASQGGLNGDINLFGFAQSRIAKVNGLFSFYDQTPSAANNQAGGINTSTTAVTAISFAMSSGNITSGSLTLYGMKI